jgi:DNA (cytosine-5)-methyltransferase 1
MPIPVIDLFAGPGGLGEGFSRCTTAIFEVIVSIEKDEMAFETLLLRAAHRSLARTGAATSATWKTWDKIVAESPWESAFDSLKASGDELIRGACASARDEAWNLELGPENRDVASRGIRKRLGPYMAGKRLPQNAVLIGGPPCQAYSVVGRSRNRGTDGYVAEEDHRHFLYREYLHVIEEFKPAVFVMENVKGILSSRVSNRQIFETITRDLRRPDIASGRDTGLEYILLTLEENNELLEETTPESFIVHAELHGVPQARHRVVICGVRRDVYEKAGGTTKLCRQAAPNVEDVIGDLPRLRPELSFRGQGLPWQTSLSSPLMTDSLKELRLRDDPLGKRVAAKMASVKTQVATQEDPGSGVQRNHSTKQLTLKPAALATWYHDRPLSLLANHQSRSHMPSDIVRYLFVAAYGQEAGTSPRLADFPVALLPSHKNVDPLRPGDAIFKDRFRVQLANTFSMTVTSHIGKDGHAFIHPDPTQCRSLTVREAARLQTFPDSYVFLGNRTSQYTQVGNAVPPFLAQQIANVVAQLMLDAGIAQ